MATIPENAARNADGSLQNPAAWGITPSSGPQPGSYDPNNAPSVNWDALNQSGFGGLYNGMQGNELDQILANSRRNFERTGVIDSNLSGYLNNRDTARQLGLVGNNQELDMNNLFGGLGDMQTLEFGPGNGAQGNAVSFQDTGQNATNNIARVMQALGGGGYTNLGDYMTGFNGTPQYGVFGAGQSARGLQETLLRNGLTGGLGMISASLPNGTFQGANPASTRYNQENFNYAGPRTTPTAPSPPPAQPGANPTTGYGVNQPPPQGTPNGQTPMGMPQPPVFDPNNPAGYAQQMAQYAYQVQQWMGSNYGGGGNQQQAPQGPANTGYQAPQNYSYTPPGIQASNASVNGYSPYGHPNPGNTPWSTPNSTNPWASWGSAPPTPTNPNYQGPTGQWTPPATSTDPNSTYQNTSGNRSGSSNSGAWGNGGRRASNWMWGY